VPSIGQSTLKNAATAATSYAWFQFIKQRITSAADIKLPIQSFVNSTVKSKLRGKYLGFSLED
jgi:hypothetical protein